MAFFSFRSVVGGTLLAASLSGAATAGAPPLPSWTGFYLGAEIGASSVASKFNSSPGGLPLPSTWIGSVSNSGSFGAFAGFNYRLSSLLVTGMEVEFQQLNGTSYVSEGSAVDFLEKSKYTGALTARLGLLVSPGTLLYAKAGPALLTANGFQGFGAKLNKTLTEFHGGLGVETRIGNGFSVRFEGTYTGLGQGLSVNTGTYRYRPSVLQSKIGLIWTPWETASSVVAPGAAPPPNWTGFHAGGLLSLHQHHMQTIDSVANAGLFGDLPVAATSVGGRLLIGGDVQLPIPVVLGVEASLDLQHARFVNPNGSGGILGGQIFYNFANVDGMGAVTARAGWLASPDMLLYARVGAAWINTGIKSNFFNDIAPNTNVGHRLLPGLQVGSGVETYLLPNVSARVEATYTKAGKTILLNGTNGANEFKLKPSNFAVSSGLVYHF